MTNADLAEPRPFLHVQVERSVLVKAFSGSRGPGVLGLRGEGLGAWTPGAEGGGPGEPGLLGLREEGPEVQTPGLRVGV